MRERMLRCLLCAALGACVPNMKQAGLRDARVSLPAQFADGMAETGEPVLPDRSEVFDDPALVALIDEALQNNQELEILRREISVAWSEVRARRGEILPRVDLDLGAGKEKVGLYTSQGANDAGAEIEPGREVPEHLGNLRISLDASWEVDVWKKLRNASKAARYRYLSTIEGRNLVVTAVVAEVAESYYELLALDSQLDVVQTNIELLQNSLEVVRMQKQAARVTELAVQRFEAELLKNQSRQFEIRQAIVETENRLNLLLGRYPQRVIRSGGNFLGRSAPVFETGVPAALLEQRPDVRAAELELEAAKLDVKVARALFYPSLSIDASLGYEAFRLARLAATPESLLYDVAGRLLTPLLNRKAIRAEYSAANAKQMQAVVHYERTVLQAYIEVATQLARIDNLDQGAALRSQQVERLERAIETSTGLFRSARADWLEVLTTRREALESQMELIETKQRQLGARVVLYRALGGGWSQVKASP